MGSEVGTKIVKGVVEVVRTIKDILIEEASAYATGRKFAYRKHGKKKITHEELRKEIAVARIIGEMSGAERVISSLVANPDWTREDLEAEIHLFVVNCGDASSEIMKTENIIDLDTVLETHGYFKKHKENQEE